MTKKVVLDVLFGNVYIVLRQRILSQAQDKVSPRYLTTMYTLINSCVKQMTETYEQHIEFESVART